MKIKVLFFSQKIKWDKKWIFIGKSYQNLNNLEKKIKGKRIKIDKSLHITFKSEIKNYLFWVEAQRKAFNDSPYWWMNDLAGRNNIYSDFFLFICQIKTIKKILLRLKKEKEILIICDELHLMKSLISNLKNKKIILDYSINIISLKYFFFNYLNIFKNFLISFINSFLWFIICKGFIKKQKQPFGNQILIHTYSDRTSLLNNRKLTSRYFPYLQEYFKKKKINYSSLYWFYPFWRGRVKAIENIHNNKGFLPEQWIKFSDYFVSFKNIIKTYLVIKSKINYRNLDIYHLIVREKKQYLINSIYNLRFWLYLPAIKKWSSRCSSLTVIDHYENMVFEHALILAIRNLKIKNKAIGYHHTLSSKEFTAWHSVKSEWSSKYKPDKVVTCGKISNNLLKSQGIPTSRLISGPALRFKQNLNISKNFKKKSNYILFPLSQNKDSSYELLNCVKILSNKLKNTNYKLIIKPHPNFEIKHFLSKLEMKLLPENVKISNKDLDALLSECLFSIILSTGASYNAILSGSIVFSLQSEIHLVDNYLDIFQKKFSFLKSLSIGEISYNLIDLNNNKNKLNKLKSKYLKLSFFIKKGFNKINTSRLSHFIG